jgi:hypothetical protein
LYLLHLALLSNFTAKSESEKDLEHTEENTAGPDSTVINSMAGLANLLCAKLAG